MTLRRHFSAIVVALFAPAFAPAASYDTANFTVEAPTAKLAQEFGEWAETYRKEKALEWTGREMPQWPRRCPLQVQITQNSAGGATTFTFGQEGGRPVVTSLRMEIRGEKQQLLHSVLPHEVTHTVLAHYFGRPVPRWADEGGSVLSENDDERYNHDVRCRELLNAGRGIRLRVLFRMTEYPRDMIVLYAQGYSVSHYLVRKGGDGREGRGKLLQFLGMGMQGNNAESWNAAANKVYGFDTIDALEESWLTALKAPPDRVVARGTHSSAGLTSASAARTELRSSAAPTVPLLEPPVRAVRGTAPDRDRESARPTYLPPPDPSAFGSSPVVRPPQPEPPPPSLLLPPELPRPVKP
ncbi:hypothetical protein VT84_34520 [Gemmata sp. SH-PL17]|uniref:hypothetical protein n=1 Tax=Gemmata sp. SH-PL17 TaxID=1630693 RepID=UPI0004B82FD2|nr:hypothetical protein [Gemmata sp. SH-PL17]AMV29561.1 hypothetical protein VT84_34520 [Gemmata sp. SH-PL17]